MERVNSEASADGRPIFAYYAWSRGDRLVLCLRFETVFDARKGCRAIMKRLVAHNLGHRITRHAPEEIRGVFEVELTFCQNVDPTQVNWAFEQPPASNRGVTKNE